MVFSSDFLLLGLRFGWLGSAWRSGVGAGYENLPLNLALTWGLAQRETQAS
jgi:hypothetical protein